MIGILRGAIAAAEAEGEALRAEFYRPEGPRGRGGSAPIDTEMEERLRARLQALVPCAFAGEETGVTPATQAGYEAWRWLVDPQDGTFEFLNGRRGSAIAIGLLRDNRPVLGVVCSPFSPDRGHDTIAWAEGSPILRNGRPLEPGAAVPEVGWATASAAARPETFSRAFFPLRYVAMPSIAYRLARVAAGDGLATVSAHPVNEYDIAAGMALVLAAGGALYDSTGAEIVLTGDPQRRVQGCFAGRADVAQRLARFPWPSLDQEPKRPLRLMPRYPKKPDELRLARATGCLLGQVIGDSLGSRVEFKDAAAIAAAFPQGVRELADGGVFHTIAGQPTDDSEMALALARTIAREGRYAKEPVLAAYRDWLQTRPIDVGATTERGLLGMHTMESEANGSLMRVSPIGIWAAGDPGRAAAAGRDDSSLTHPNEVCVEACAAFCAAIAAGVAGGERSAMLEAALANSTGRAREAVSQGWAGKLPADYVTHMGWVLIALQNAFYCLAHSDLEAGLVQTVGRGGDTDTNAAIAGALLGAAHGREAIPPRWILPVLACRALEQAGAPRPRPMDYWPDDLLDLAEALLET